MADRRVLTAVRRAGEPRRERASPRGLIACQLGHALARPTLNYNDDDDDDTATQASVGNRCVKVIRRPTRPAAARRAGRLGLDGNCTLNAVLSAYIQNRDERPSRSQEARDASRHPTSAPTTQFANWNRNRNRKLTCSKLSSNAK